MKKQFRSFSPVFFTVFLDMFGFGLVIPILAPLFFDPTGVVHATYSHTLRSLMFGLVLALYPFAQLFGAPFLGALSDKIGRKKVILYSLLGAFFGYILFGIGVAFHRVSLLFLSRILSGFMGGNIAVAWSSLADASSEEEKVKNFSLMGIAYALGLI
ncbi:MAG: MFS transporter, partial [Parcubacteria group bacterium]|nr:MFS transporter [Parcubacteria group bacterium]